MPGRIRNDLWCPMCGREVMLVFHERTREGVTSEYEHREDVPACRIHRAPEDAARVEERERPPDAAAPPAVGA